MLWFLLSLSSAILQSSRELFNKKMVSLLDEYIVMFTETFFSAVCLVPFTLLSGVPTINHTFWVALLSNGGIVVIGRILYLKALKTSPLSLIAPLSSLMPLFLLITSPIMLGETPNTVGFAGVVVVVVGMYFLSIKDISQGYLAPFKALTKEQGAVFAIIVAFLYSIGSNLVKIGVQESNPFFFSLLTTLLLSTASFPLMLTKSQDTQRKLQGKVMILFLFGAVNASQFILTTQAMQITLVSYVMAIRRTVVVLTSTLFGYFILKEKRIIERLSGAIIMIIGILLITIA